MDAIKCLPRCALTASCLILALPPSPPLYKGRQGARLRGRGHRQDLAETAKAPRQEPSRRDRSIDQPANSHGGVQATPPDEGHDGAWLGGCVGVGGRVDEMTLFHRACAIDWSGLQAIHSHAHTHPAPLRTQVCLPIAYGSIAWPMTKRAEHDQCTHQWSRESYSWMDGSMHPLLGWANRRLLF